jgi:hypothetical protein
MSLLAAFAAVAALVTPAPADGGAIFTGDRAGATKAGGYVEQEYFVSGRIGGRPYRTTLLVRRPADPKRFSGVVLVEPVHIGGYSALWAFSDVITSGGHGYVLVGAQRAPLDQVIRKTNPARYAELTIPAASAEDVERESLPGELSQVPPETAHLLKTSQAEAPYALEIMSQVGAMLKADPVGGPFAGMKVRRLFTGGYSQSGQLTLMFVRQKAAEAILANGEPVYDGFLPLASTGDRPLPPHPGAVLQAFGEGDYLNVGRASHGAYRRPDSDDPNDRYRLWEVPAASHISMRGRAASEEARQTYGPGERPSQFPGMMIYAAAMQDLIDWISRGTPPPRAERLMLQADGGIVRDSHGNALGGVRSSYLDVPVAGYVAAAPGARRFYGIESPLPKAELQRLYPTHADYAARARASIRRMVRERFLRPADGGELMAEADQAPVP